MSKIINEVLEGYVLKIGGYKPRIVLETTDNILTIEFAFKDRDILANLTENILYSHQMIKVNRYPEEKTRFQFVEFL